VARCALVRNPHPRRLRLELDPRQILAVDLAPAADGAVQTHEVLPVAGRGDADASEESEVELELTAVERGVVEVNASKAEEQTDVVRKDDKGLDLADDELGGDGVPGSASIGVAGFGIRRRSSRNGGGGGHKAVYMRQADLGEDLARFHADTDAVLGDRPGRGPSKTDVDRERVDLDDITGQALMARDRRRRLLLPRRLPGPGEQLPVELVRVASRKGGLEDRGPPGSLELGGRLLGGGDGVEDRSDLDPAEPAGDERDLLVRRLHGVGVGFVRDLVLGQAELLAELPVDQGPTSGRPSDVLELDPGDTNVGATELFVVRMARVGRGEAGADVADRAEGAQVDGQAVNERLLGRRSGPTRLSVELGEQSSEGAHGLWAPEGDVDGLDGGSQVRIAC
jgi:hypothetical protein